LGRAAKPKRFAAPALLPTASSGFRPLREALVGRAEPLPLREVALDLPAAGALLEWPLALRPLQDGAADLLVRDSGLPLLFAPFPLFPLAEEPARFPFDSAAALGLQRAGEAERPPLVARALAGRESEALRRAGRLAEEDCAGLRSRECGAGRLKCGRAALDFWLGAGLRTVGILGACTSTIGCGTICSGMAGAGGSGITSSAAATSGNSSSNSLPRMK
jgi:hypothetical protein